MTNRFGQQFGNYRLLRPLGQGGFAEVYLAEHVHLQTQAAVKILYGKITTQDIQTFTHEARTIASLNHPHILKVLDFDFAQSVPFLVMEYAPGGTLRDRHPSGSRVPLVTIVDYLRQVGAALSYAHKKKLIHRDVKPENLLINANGHILLSDFGIVATAHNTASMKTTDKVGTVQYMAPEHLRGKPRPASDQYALATVVYEWLCGEVPFTGNTTTEIIVQQMMDQPPALRVKAPAISVEVEQVVHKALAKEPDQRYASIDDFVTALEQVSRGIPPTQPAYALSSKGTKQGSLFSTKQMQVVAPAVPMTPIPSDTLDPQTLEEFRHSIETTIPKGWDHGALIVCVASNQVGKAIHIQPIDSYETSYSSYGKEHALVRRYLVNGHTISAAVFKKVRKDQYVVWTDGKRPYTAIVVEDEANIVNFQKWKRTKFSLSSPKFLQAFDGCGFLIGAIVITGSGALIGTLFGNTVIGAIVGFLLSLLIALLDSLRSS